MLKNLVLNRYPWWNLPISTISRYWQTYNFRYIHDLKTKLSNCFTLYFAGMINNQHKFKSEIVETKKVKKVFNVF